MIDRPLTIEEKGQLQTAIKELEVRRASLAEDLEAGMPVEPQIAAIDQGIKTATHLLKKYGAPAAIRPKRK